MHRALLRLPLRALSRQLPSRSIISRPTLAPLPSRPHCFSVRFSSSLSPGSYHAIADNTMDSLTRTLEELLETTDSEEMDVECTSGVLTLKLGREHGTYVINKQPPNQQIWLSSPTSGPKRYDWDEERKRWVYGRDGSSLRGLLEEELNPIFEEKVEFEEGV